MAAHTPSILEPIRLCRSDGKSPDGVTLKSGHTLAWGMPPVQVPLLRRIWPRLQGTGSRSCCSIREERKEAKYLDLAQMHHFIVVAVEAAGAMGSDALKVFADIGSQESEDLHQSFSS